MEKKDGNKIVPNVTGLHTFTALNHLKHAGIKVRNVFLDEDSTQPNHVFKQSIKYGTEIDDSKSIDLYVSSINLIRYLPSIYQSHDQNNGDFLKRYLWIFKELFDSIGYKLDRITDFFTPLHSPPEFLKWIASWFAMDINFFLTEDKIRYLLKEIVSLYQWRGTALGLSKYLEIVTGYKPEIIEDYKPVSEYVLENEKLTERVIVDDLVSQNYFTVLFPVSVKVFDTHMIKAINQIIINEKPAHTRYFVEFTEEEKYKPAGMSIGIDQI